MDNLRSARLQVLSVIQALLLEVALDVLHLTHKHGLSKL